MAQDKRRFLGGMNSDIEERLLPDGDYRYALNCRVGSSSEGNIGALENINGTVIQQFSLPSGYNRCIGSFPSSTRNSVIYFVYNSHSKHGIYEYKIFNNNIVKVLENPILNFDWRFLIHSIDLVKDLLFWTDNFNPPRKINLTKAINFSNGQRDINIGYSDILEVGTRKQQEEFVDAIKYPPSKPPTYIYFKESELLANSGDIKNQAFQFKYRYKYDDGEYST